jgi:hypothetical protein
MWCKHLNKEININKDFESECNKCSSEYIKRKFNIDDEEEKDYNPYDLSIKDQFLFDFEKSKKQMIIIVVNRPEAQDSREIIINSSELDDKINYYKEAYDDELKLKRNSDVYIENYMFI